VDNGDVRVVPRVSQCVITHEESRRAVGGRLPSLIPQCYAPHRAWRDCPYIVPMGTAFLVPERTYRDFWDPPIRLNQRNF